MTVMSSRGARREREPTRINKFYIYTNFIVWYMYCFSLLIILHIGLHVHYITNVMYAPACHEAAHQCQVRWNTLRGEEHH